MQTVMMPIGDIKPYANNPRVNNDAVEKVAASLREFGFKQPIVVDKNMEIIVGHTRLKAAKKLRMKEVPVLVADDLTDEQVKAYRLADNKTAEFAKWDMDKLAEELSDILEIDMEEFGFDLKLDEDEEDRVIEEDEIPEDVEPRCQPGDVWILGDHRLICGDSTDRETIDKLMDGRTAEFAFQSPPYNVGKNAMLNSRRENKYESYDDDNKDYTRLLYASTDIALCNARYVCINIQMLAGNKEVFAEWLCDSRDVLCDIGIWYKDNAAPAMASRVMNSSFEFLVFMSKETNTRAIGTKDFRGTVSNVWQSHVQSGNAYSKIHSATFPVEFAAHYIENFTNKDETVLDLFGGTGTTMIACEQLGRRCYMSEIDPKYCDIIISRWEQFTGREGEKVV